MKAYSLERESPVFDYSKVPPVIDTGIWGVRVEDVETGLRVTISRSHMTGRLDVTVSAIDQSRIAELDTQSVIHGVQARLEVKLRA